MAVEPILARPEPKGFMVVHPLHDEPEAKCSADRLGRIQLTRGCRLALIAVRCYLGAIMLMGVYRVVELIRH
jgi:hypothetical protein